MSDRKSGDDCRPCDKGDIYLTECSRQISLCLNWVIKSKQTSADSSRLELKFGNRLNILDLQKSYLIKEEMTSHERTPLLASAREMIIDELDADELPQPIFSNSGTPSVKCKVCNNLIDLDGKLDCYVVKCLCCQEATPIKAPPIGKKYVRCQCHCLLICKAGSKRVACPRENCKLIIILEPSFESQSQTNTVSLRVMCGHCQQNFFFSSTGHLARCPHCKKVSSIRPEYERKYSMVFMLLGILFLVAGSILVGLTAPYVNTYKGLYAGYIILFLVAVIMLARAIHYSCIKVSQVENSQAYSV